MGCLDNGHQRGNRPEQFPHLVLLALGQEFLPRLFAQANQCVEVLVVKLRPAAHASLGDLAQPFLAMARVVNILAGTGNALAAIDRLYPVHDPREIFADGQISPGQLSGGISHRDGNRCGVHIHSDAFVTIHWGRSFLTGGRLKQHSKFTPQEQLLYPCQTNSRYGPRRTIFLRRHDLQDQGKFIKSDLGATKKGGAPAPR